MKPSFALVLTQDTIGLLHRTSQGWQPVGEAAVSDPELTAALGFLRQSALGLEPRGVTSKLVIPNSEILYTTVHAPGPSVSARRSQIKAALEGLTPYAVRDLVFDWSGKGPEVQVAVVARETLREAEGFAGQHRLGPLSFVGSPEAGLFDGEPWFGPAATAASLLGPGEKVERDRSPVPAPVTAEPEIAAMPVADAIEETAESAPPPVSPVEMPEAIAEPLTETPPPQPEVPAAPPSATEPEPVPAEARPEAAVVAAVEPAAPALSARVETAIAALQQPEPPPGPVADPTPPPFARPARVDVIAQSLEVPLEDLPEARAMKPAIAASAPAVERLRARLAEQPIDPRRFGASSSGPGAAPQALGADPVPGKSSGTSPSLARSLKPAPGPAAPLSAPARVGVPGARPAAARVAAKAGGRGSASMVTSPSIPIPRDRRVNIPGAEAASDARAKAAVEARKTQKAGADGMTSFGARQTRRGKPRYLGLILTGILLIVLAAVAAWSSFNTSESTADAVPVAAAPPAEAEAVTTAGPASAPLSPARSEATPEAVVVPVPAAARTAIGTVASDAVATDAPTATVLAPPAGTGVEAATTLSTSGSPDVAAPTEAAVIAPPEVPATNGRNPPDTLQDEIFLAMTDPAVPVAELIALAPPVASADPAPGPQPLPPPFGTVYRFDANGLILPTPAGVVTPEGVLLVLGKPSRVPPARPADLTPPPEQSAPSEAPAVATVADIAAASVSGVLPAPTEPAAESPPVDPALAGARPRSRPADLTPASGDDAALPRSAATQLTSVLPRARPQARIDEVEAGAAAEDAAIQSASASLAATATEAAQVGPFAITVSLRPAPRPRDFSRAVEAAVASLARPPVAAVPEEPVVAAAVPEPRPTTAPGAIPQPKPAKPAPVAKPREKPPEDEIDEPEVASAAPNLPTRTNVAKQATFRNAINLSRLNLIGVYGSSSNRSALVRQPNGRYIKVEVGDRVDGGKVAAISERELRYVKNGRTVTLAMPKS